MMKMNKNKKGFARLSAKPLFKIRQLQLLLYLSLLLNIICIASLFFIVKLVPFLIGFIITLCLFVFIYCMIQFVKTYK